jgi:hypothetical protein
MIQRQIRSHLHVFFSSRVSMNQERRIECELMRLKLKTLLIFVFHVMEFEAEVPNLSLAKILK